MRWFTQLLTAKGSHRVLIRRLAARASLAAAMGTGLASTAFAQDARPQDSDSALASFLSLPPSVQRDLINNARDILGRSHTEQCVNVGPLSHCESSDGSSYGVGEGPQVSFDRNAEGQWRVGMGVETPAVGPLSPSLSVTGYPGSVEVCAGAAYGLQPVIGGSTRECWTVDRQRIQELRQAAAYGDEMARRRMQSAPVASDPNAGQAADPQQLIMDENTRRQIWQHAYNPPVDVVGPAPAAVNRAPAPATTSQAPAGMSQDQFRASVDRSMQQFRQADTRFQQNRRAPAASGSSTSATAQSERQLVFDENAPRVRATGYVYDTTGYRQDSSRRQFDDQGNRQDSTRRQYDTQGYRTDSPRSRYDDQGNAVQSSRPRYDEQGYRLPDPGTSQPTGRVNRVYTIDGQSSPIGRGSSNPAQPARPLAYTAPSGTGSAPFATNAPAQTPAVTSFRYAAPDSTPARTGDASLTFNQSAPRVPAASPTYTAPRMPQPSTTAVQPVIPQVAPRRIGTQSATAGLEFPR